MAKGIKPYKSARQRDMIRNSVINGIYMDRLTELAIARFKWDNLPKEIDERYLEMTLNAYGSMAFFKEDVTDMFVCLPGNLESRYDIYHNPITMRVWSDNGFNGCLSKGTFVPIYNNLTRTATVPVLRYYAEQLYEIDQTRLTNIKAQKTPFIIQTGDKQRLTFKNLYLDIDSNEPVVVVDENTDLNGIKVLQTEAPFLADRITELRREIYGEIMVYLGYSTQESTRKKERIVVGEIQAAMAQSASSRFGPLEARRRACELINDKWGLDISVNFRQDFSTVVEFDNAIEQLVNSDPANLLNMPNNNMPNKNSEGGIVNE